MNSTKIATLILALLFIQTVFRCASADDDEYFQKSIFRALKEKKGQFSSDMQMTRYHFGHRFSAIISRGQEEKFSFKSNIGLYSVYGAHHYIHWKKLEHTLYVDDKELYTFLDRSKYCYSWKSNKYEKSYHLSEWAPNVVFQENPKSEKHDYKIIGPNSLLEVFYLKHGEEGKVKCEDGNVEGVKNPKKCSILFDDTVRLDYSFVDREEYTMFPTKIERFAKEKRDGQITGKWVLANELQYLNFTPTFSEEQIVSSDLPIQKGCKRMNKESYPTIKTDYGTKFELELEVNFNYSRMTYNWSDGSRKVDYTARVYPVKLFMNKDDSISVADTIDETTNASIRTYYDEKSHFLHSVTLENNECQTYNLTSNRSLNWFYVQEMFARKPELFYANSNYSYLREFSLDGVSSQVFEKRVRYAWSYGGKSTTRKRNNYVSTDGFMITTHYYPKDTNHWPDNPNGLSIPKRIEISIDDFSPTAYSTITIDIKSFKSSPEEVEKYDTSKCKDMDKNTQQ